VKLSNLMRPRNSILFDWFRFTSIRFKKIGISNFFLTFFQIFMIRFGRIELAVYPNKALDWMQKRLLFWVRFGRTESWKFEKKIKNSKFVRQIFPNFRFDSISIWYGCESFTVLIYWFLFFFYRWLNESSYKYYNRI